MKLSILLVLAALVALLRANEVVPETVDDLTERGTFPSPPVHSDPCNGATGEWAIILQAGEFHEEGEDTWCPTITGVIDIEHEYSELICSTDNGNKPRGSSFGEPKCCARAVFYSCMSLYCNWDFMPLDTQYFTDNIFPMFAYVGRENFIDEIEDQDLGDRNHFAMAKTLHFTNVNSDMMLLEGGPRVGGWSENEFENGEGEEAWPECTYNGWAYRRTGNKYFREQSDLNARESEDFNSHPRSGGVRVMMQDDFTNMIPKEFFQDAHWRNHTLAKANFGKHPMFTGSHAEKESRKIRSQHSTTHKVNRKKNSSKRHRK